MKNGDLIEILRSFPEDLEVTLTFTDGEEVTVEFRPYALASETTLDLDIGDVQGLEVIERNDFQIDSNYENSRIRSNEIIMAHLYRVYTGPPCE